MDHVTTTCRSVGAFPLRQHAEHLLSQWGKLYEHLPSMGARTIEAVLGGYAREDADRWVNRIADIAYLAGLSGGDKMALTIEDAHAMRMVEESLGRAKHTLGAS